VISDSDVLSLVSQLSVLWAPTALLVAAVAGALLGVILRILSPTVIASILVIPGGIIAVNLLLRLTRRFAR
jgi:hypothetical protein